MAGIMSRVPADVKRLFVRRLYEYAATKSTTILALLKTLTESRFQETQMGKVVVITGGVGKNVTFHLPEDFTTTDAAAMISELRDRYDEVVTWFKSVKKVTAPTDLQIHNELLKTIKPITRIVRDFTDLRIEPSETSGQ